MLTIHPGLASNVNRVPAFGRSSVVDDYEDNIPYVDYEDVTDSYDNFVREDNRDFDIDKAKSDTKKELDLWKQTKANVDSIAKQADMVPGVKTGTKILSGLTAIAIGWGGLRWGTVGTLEVLSKIGQTDLMKAVGKGLSNSRKFVAKKASDLGTYVSGRNWYKAASKKVDGLENSFFESSVGKTLSGWKTAVTSNGIYKDAVKYKDKTVDYFKNLNYKRVFVETMGVAGGGTAAVNVLGGKTIDGRRQNVEVDENGRYFVNGREMQFDEGDVSDAA